jgi:hypothetical protein
MSKNTDWRAVLEAAGFHRHAADLWTDSDERVGAREDEAGLLVGWIDVDWDGPSTPTLALRRVRRLSGAASERDFVSAVRAARRQQLVALVACRYCKLRNLPGHMHGDVCHSCAERHLGIMH